MVYTIGRMIEDLRTISGENSSDWFGSKAKMTAEEALAIFFSGRWAFNQGEGVVSTRAPYSTGTVAIANGGSTVTLTGGTWSTSWTVPAVIRINGSGGDNFLVTAFPTNATATIDGNWPYDAETVAEYSLEFPAHDLSSYLTVETVTQSRLTTVASPRRTSMGSMLAMRPWQPASFWPAEYDVVPGDGVTSQKLFIWPPPAEVQTLRYRYVKAVPAFRAYREGVASVTNANTAASGTGTYWNSQGYSLAGQYLEMIAQPGHQVLVSSVTNDAALVLAAGGYTGRTEAGGAYWISPSILVPDDLKPLLRAIMRWKYHEDAVPKLAEQSRARYLLLRDQAVARYDVARDPGVMQGIDAGMYDWGGPPPLPAVLRVE